MAESTSIVDFKIKSIKNKIKAINNKVDAFEDKLVDGIKYRWQMKQLYKVEREISKKYEAINKPLRQELEQLTIDYDILSKKINKSPQVDLNGKKVSQKNIFDYMFPKNGVQNLSVINDEVLEAFQQKFGDEYLEILKLQQYYERKSKLEHHLFKGMGGNLPETEELDKETVVMLKKLHKTARIKEDKLQVIVQGLKQDFMSALSKNPQIGTKISDYKPEMKFDETWGEMVDVTYDKSVDFLMEASWFFSGNISKRYPQLAGCLKDIENCIGYDNPEATAELRAGCILSYYKGTVEDAPEVIPHEFSHFLQEHDISALPKRALKIFDKYGPLNNMIPHENRAFERESIIIGETIAKNFKHDFNEFLKSCTVDKNFNRLLKSRD